MNSPSASNTPPHSAIRTGKILVVDDEANARQTLSELLRAEGHDVRQAADGHKAMGVLAEFTPDIILTDLKMPFMNGIELIERVKAEYPDVVCIVMTAFASIDTAVNAMRRGADDYLTKPLNFDAVELILHRTLERVEMVRELRELREFVPGPLGRTQIIGNSESLRQATLLIERVAPSRATVLVTGESGTGKELAARMLHEQSPRVDGPFVPLHCAALPDTLLESELFGHEKGSFTGAHSRRRGKLEEADGGTVFLDEIGEISPATQVKLLRFLQTNSIERVGGNETLHLDVRIVAATNRDLAKEVREGRFREDLYYRLNVINIEMPPLRTRTGDIALLIRHFTTKYALENQKTIDEIAPAFLHALEQHEWPGNVRELENIVERAVVLAQGSSLEVAHLPAVLGHAELGHNISEHIQIPGATLAALERYAILRTYEATGGDTRRTSEILAISQRKVQYKLREYSEE